MIIGAHTIVYSKDPEADRTFLREALRLPHVDVGGGWLIFGLPPSEVAVHPAEESGRQELYLMCDDVAGFVREMAARGVACAPVTDQRWGLLTEIVLPGGGRLGVYEPRHARPREARSRAAARPSRPRAKSRPKKPPANRGAKRKAKAKPSRRR